MNKLEIVKKILEKNHGYLCLQNLKNEKISREYISGLVKKGILTRAARGIYVSPDIFDDEMFKLQYRFKKVIFSHETALYLHGMTDRDPLKYSVTIASGDTRKNLQEANLKVYSVKKELLDLGLELKNNIFGNDVKTYDLERTVCDIVRSRSRIDPHIFSETFKNYISYKNKDLPKLMRYAKKFKLEKIINNHLEVML